MKQKTVFAVLINGGVWKVLSSREKVEQLFKDDGVEKFIFEEDGEGVEFVEGINHLLQMGSMGEVVECYNEELCEMGDDYCELSIVESKVS